MTTLEKKSRRKLSNLQSGLVCEIYEEYDGKWESIMLDERIKALDRSREYLATHIANKAKYTKRKYRAHSCLEKSKKRRFEEQEIWDSDYSENSENSESLISTKKSRNSLILKFLSELIEEDNCNDELKERQERVESKLDQLQSSLNEILALLKK